MCCAWSGEENKTLDWNGFDAALFSLTAASSISLFTCLAMLLEGRLLSILETYNEGVDA